MSCPNSKEKAKEIDMTKVSPTIVACAYLVHPPSLWEIHDLWQEHTAPRGPTNQFHALSASTVRVTPTRYQMETAWRASSVMAVLLFGTLYSAAMVTTAQREPL